MTDLKYLELSTPQVAAADPTRGSIFFVGTATVLLRFGGFTILTDRISCMPETTLTWAMA
ncbi:MAG TPA: hypothetical protein VK900_16915 [Anaerolineales bacterium]|nr:hypothetical protein [Anaerolineales bacterium]